MKFSTSFYWFTYIISVLLISASMGYLIALCPCNTDMVIGMLFALLCYVVLGVSIVFHFVKIARMSVGGGLLAAVAFSFLGGIIVAAASESPIAEMVAPNYFMEWMMTGSTIGLFNAIGMFAIPFFRDMKSNVKS